MEIEPVAIPQRKGDPTMVEKDEHPRAETTLDGLTKLKAPFRGGGSVTAGNASGVNDGAAALILASEEAAKAHGLTPIARVLGGAVAGVPPCIMGIGPAPAFEEAHGAARACGSNDFDVIELNEAFASQGLAMLRQLGVPDDDPRVNPNGGAIALGHPLGMSRRAHNRHGGVGTEPQWRQAARSRPCASASVKASPSPSNGCDLLGLGRKPITPSSQVRSLCELLGSN